MGCFKSGIFSGTQLMGALIESQNCEYEVCLRGGRNVPGEPGNSRKALLAGAESVEPLILLKSMILSIGAKETC